MRYFRWSDLCKGGSRVFIPNKIKKTDNRGDYQSLLVQEVGLEPTQPVKAKGF